MRDDFNKLLEKHLKNPEFKREYEALQPEANIIQAIINARKDSHLTQRYEPKKTILERFSMLHKH